MLGSGEACQFCLNCGESEEQARGHRLRTASGLVSCPILRSLSCPICGATGDFAHTKSYCPLVDMDREGSNINNNVVKTKNTMSRSTLQPAPRTWPLSSYQKLVSNYTGTIRQPPAPAPAPAPVCQPLDLEPTSPLLAQHQQFLDYYRSKWMEHQAEINRLKTLRKKKLQSQVSKPPPGSNTLYYRTFRAPAKTPEDKHRQHFFPDSMQVGTAMMMRHDQELDIELAKLREGTVEVKMY